jgi:N-acetylmuramoyl-L-alanine amidase
MRFPALWGAALLLATAVGADATLSGRRIVIDPGHGTIDFERQIINSGKSRDGVNEYRLNMDIALFLGKMLEDDGATVFLTRDREDYWRSGYGPAEDNKARAFFANEVNADAFIAIHCDWHPSRRFHGVTTFYTKDKSRELGERIQRQMVKDLGAFDRKLVKDSFTVLDHTEMPAVLVESGFLSNRAEGKKLMTAAYQKKVAAALAAALRGYFSQTR